MRIFMKADDKQQGELSFRQFGTLMRDMGLEHFQSVSTGYCTRVAFTFVKFEDLNLGEIYQCLPNNAVEIHVARVRHLSVLGFPIF